MKCDTCLYIDVGVDPWEVRCDLDKGHEGSHIFYGDNYKLVWLKTEHIIENYKNEVITDELKERCKRKFVVENLMEGIF